MRQDKKMYQNEAFKASFFFWTLGIQNLIRSVLQTF